MIRALDPHEVEALLAAGDVDVVDVREPSEYATGHVPNARNVPLGALQANPRAALPRDRVLLVCARGMRSQTAGKLAEELGHTEVYHLDGGTQAWAGAGLTLTRPAVAPPTVAARAEAIAPAPVDDAASCGLPEPGLDAVVGANMRELRMQRNLTLDQLARLTGLSRTLLGQIELGKAPPSVSVVWRIAEAFDVQFATLIARPGHVETRVLLAADARRLVSADGRFSSRALFPLDARPGAEFYELSLAGHSREDAKPHRAGTRENLIVTAGRLELTAGSERYELATGDAILFAADVPHAYVNPGREECRMYLVMTYASSLA